MKESSPELLIWFFHRDLEKCKGLLHNRYRSTRALPLFGWPFISLKVIDSRTRFWEAVTIQEMCLFKMKELCFSKLGMGLGISILWELEQFFFIPASAVVEIVLT